MLEINTLFLFSCYYLIVQTTTMENERLMITIYVFGFPPVLKDVNMTGKDIKINSLFLLSLDYLTVSRTIIWNERFMITIYVSLFALGWKDYSVNIQDLSNWYKRSIACSFFPVVT